MSPTPSSGGANIAPGGSIGPSGAGGAHSADLFSLTATASDFGRYYPTYLANGYFSTHSSPQGTAPALSLMTGLMDYTDGDVSRPAALPGWTEIDYCAGGKWLNAAELSPEQFADYRQVLRMRDGMLETHYRWHAGTHVTRIEVTTFVSQTERHLAATRLRITPEFGGRVQLRVPLRNWPRPVQRLELAKMSWPEMKDVLARSSATRPRAARAGAPPVAPPEIRTWFDLQEALAAEGRELVFSAPTEPTRAAIWYPGEVRVESVCSSGETMTLALEARAINGAAVWIAAAVEFTGGRPLSVKAVNTSDGATLEYEVEVSAGETCEVAKFVSAAWAGPGGALTAELERCQQARRRGFSALANAQRAAWRQLWRSDIEIEGDDAVQRALRADLFYLLQNSSVGTSRAMTACGMSPHYYGHIFWDNDTWHFPAMLMLHPERARPLVDYRHRTLPWAKANATRFGLQGAKYAWEADPENGSEQTPRFAGVNGEREIHLQGAIAASQWMYFQATGDREWLRTRGYPVIRATADFWLSRVTCVAEKQRYEIHHVTSVDEKYTDVNNEAFTNAVAQRNLRIATAAAGTLGEPPDPRWAEVADKMFIPFSEKERRHLVFDEDVPHDRRTWMAGAITFLTYPALDLPMTDEVRRNDYAYALAKNAELSPEPNEMMLVMLAIHAAQLGLEQDAWRWLRGHSDGFLKGPFLVRSETPRNNCTYILATAGGSLQSFLYGFTGLRFADEGLVPRYRPLLPGPLRRIVVRGVVDRGARYDFTVRRGGDGVVRLERTPSTH